MALKRAVFFCWNTFQQKFCLTSKSVQSTSLAFQCVNDIHGGDCLSLGVLGVRYCISDNILQENFQYTPSFFVDQTRDSLYTTSSSQTSDGGFGDTLDIVSQNFPVSLGATFSKTLSSFSTTGHVD